MSGDTSIATEEDPIHNDESQGSPALDFSRDSSHAPTPISSSREDGLHIDQMYEFEVYRGQKTVTDIMRTND